MIYGHKQICFVLSFKTFEGDDCNVLFRVLRIDKRISIQSMLPIHYPSRLVLIWKIQMTELHISCFVIRLFLKSPFFIEIDQDVS